MKDSGDRFLAWNPMGIPAELAEASGLPGGGQAWPIEDTLTSGRKRGPLRPHQVLCWCNSGEAQSFVLDLLNAGIEMIGPEDTTVDAGRNPHVKGVYDATGEEVPFVVSANVATGYVKRFLMDGGDFVLDKVRMVPAMITEMRPAPLRVVLDDGEGQDDGSG